MVNTKHDTTSCESCSYKREIFDINILHEAFTKAKIGSDWKPQVQKFEMNLLTELSSLQKDLISRTFKFSKPNEFILSERGKTRVISGDCIRDRVVKRALCDEVLIPSIRKYLIHDNGASLRGKGIGFTRDRLDVHLRKYYQENKSNEGYILLGDYSKFFDNIQHDLLLNMFKNLIDDELALWLLDGVLKQAKVDVSFMTKEQFSNSLNEIFNSLEYEKVDKKLMTGEKFLAKHMNIGDQVAQVAGIFYPHRLDNYIKIVEGEKYYGRYMDDFYVISRDKEHLKELSSRIRREAKRNGIILNENKTRICKISQYWRYLQIQYALTENGRVIKKIHPKRLTVMRRKLKKLANKLSEVDFINYYNSCFKNQYKLMSKKQRENMNELFKNLKEERYVSNNA